MNVLTPRVRFNARSHVGLKRKVNEDAVLALPEQNIWVVSDGMGGHEAGDFASRLITDMIATIEPDLPATERMHALRHAIQKAHGLIRDEAKARGVATIGATVASLMISNSHFVGIWAGDSRIYRLHKGEIQMLTADHSLVAALVGGVVAVVADGLPLHLGLLVGALAGIVAGVVADPEIVER